MTVDVRERPASPVAGERPRVVLVLNSLVLGGAETQLTSLLEADPATLEWIQLELLVVTSRRHPLIVQRLEILGLPITTIDRAQHRFLPFFAALVRYFRQRRPDIVHTVLTGSSGTWGRLAARLAGVPRVMHSDLSLVPNMSSVQRALTPLVDRLTDRFLPNAAAIAERLRRQGVPARKIRLVRNGVDLTRFDPDAATSLRPAWGIAEGAVVAGFLGMFRREKRPELLLEAVLRLPPEDRPDYLVMAGDGELMPELRRRVDADPWLKERCRLLGVVADTPGLLSSIDFLVLTSDTEGLPNAILEAMAMARPAVATRVSDVPFLLGEHGFLVAPGDAQALGDAIARMVQLGAEQRAAMGRALLARARSEFGMENAVRTFWDAHLELLPKGSG